MELSNIEPQDAGDFVCQISLKAGETLEIAHTVEVLGKVKLLQSICGPKICIKYSKHGSSFFSPKQETEKVKLTIFQLYFKQLFSSDATMCVHNFSFLFPIKT